MSKLALIFLAFVFGAPSASTLADELPKSRSMADICPSKVTPRMKAAAIDDLVLRIPHIQIRAGPTASEAGGAGAAERHSGA